MRNGPEEQGGYLASWSGGKDSCHALFRALRRGMRIEGLLNCVDQGHGRVSFHGMRPDLIEAQALLLRFPLLQQQTTAERYADEFKQGVRELGKGKRISGMVFGDIYLDEHLAWVEGVCSDLGIAAVEPLWGGDRGALLRDFIDAGFEAVIIAANAGKIGAEWIGRRVDHAFRAYLEGLPDVDPCGERGEYHTLVTGGPLFRGRIEITSSEVVERGGYRFLDIHAYHIIEQ